MENKENKQEKRKTKVLITILLIITIIIILLLLLRCSAKKEPEVIENNTSKTSEVVHKEEIVGGYVEAKDKTITPELRDLFERATANITDMKYEPEELVATQVVSGINYKFLATGTSEEDPSNKQKYYIYIYEDLQGNAEVTDTEEIIETEETEKTQKQKTINLNDGTLDTVDEETTTPSSGGGSTNPPVDNNIKYNSVYEATNNSVSPAIKIQAIFTHYEVDNKEQVLIDLPQSGSNKSFCLPFTITEGNPKTATVDMGGGKSLTINIGSSLSIPNINIGDPNLDGKSFNFTCPYPNYIDGVENGFAYKGNEYVWIVTKDEELSLPSTINGTTMKSIGKKFNKYRDTFTKLTIPNTIEEIKTNAFDNSFKLTELTFAENSNLKLIGDGAFNNCGRLTTVNIPKSVEKIGKSAFANLGTSANKGANSPITFEKTKISEGAKLKTIGVEAFRKVAGLVTVEIPESVEVIERGAFKECDITNVIFSGDNPHLAEIQQDAFINKTSTSTTITVPLSVTKIEFGAIQMNGVSYAFALNSGIVSIWKLNGTSSTKEYNFTSPVDAITDTEFVDFKLGVAGDTSFSEYSSIITGQIPYFERSKLIVLPTDEPVQPFQPTGN